RLTADGSPGCAGGDARRQLLREILHHALRHEVGAGFDQRGELSRDLDLGGDGHRGGRRVVLPGDAELHGGLGARAAEAVLSFCEDAAGDAGGVVLDGDFRLEAHFGGTELDDERGVVRTVFLLLAQLCTVHAFNHGTRIRQYFPHDARGRGYLDTFV